MQSASASYGPVSGISPVFFAANGMADSSGQEQQLHVTSVGCGSSHSVALLSNGTVVSFGRGEDGQLGHGDASERLSPEAVRALSGSAVDKVYCGAEYTFASSRSNKKLYSWGWGDFGRLGHGDCHDVFLPEPVSSLCGRVVRSVACGDTHTLVVTGDGELYSFGRNQNGQLGLESRDDALAPQRVKALQDQEVISISCGAEHSLAATATGEVYAWGWGRYGNLGVGELTDRLLPTKVQGLAGRVIDRVACGWRHSLVVDKEGRVCTFGWSRYGQLGHGDNEDQLVPKQVDALAHVRVAHVAGGWRHTVAADEQGRLYAWGWNKFGQLGLGSNEDVNAPQVVGGALEGEVVSSVSCGWRHTLTVTQSRKLFSWGRGVNGQLGLGSAADRSSPQLVEALSIGSIDMTALRRPQTTGGAAAAYVPASERYAVVPDQRHHGTGAESSSGPGANGGMAVPDVGTGEPPAKRAKPTQATAAS